ncbi:MAG TPA: hypothetical protein VGN08_08690 [Solirubrobacteraceae bacterium]|jgi:hypothetical protein
MRTGLLRLYPEAWRERYGEEMAALIEDTDPSITAALDLLRGALVAHLRPPMPVPSEVRARGTVATVLGCFIGFCAFGSGFAKTTENFQHAERLHPVLGTAHSVILISAAVALSVLVLAAVPLAMASFAHARRTPERVLIKLIATPPAAIVGLAVALGLLTLWVNVLDHHGGVVLWLLFGLSVLTAAGGGFACWAAPRALLRRIEVSRRVFAFSLPALGLVAVSMVAVATATGVFLIAMVVDAPQLGASGNGPGELIDVTTSIALQFGGMLALAAMAVVSATRGVLSVRTL